MLKLQNFTECFCCREIEQCVEALQEALEEEWAEEEQVGDEIKKNEPPLCVTVKETVHTTSVLITSITLLLTVSVCGFFQVT